MLAGHTLTQGTEMDYTALIDRQWTVRSRIDWLSLEQILRGILSDQSLEPTAKLRLIDEALAAWTKRGHSMPAQI